MNESRKNKILIVDDDPINIHVVTNHLIVSGYKIITAYSGQEALEKIKKFQPSLILLDIMMPGMDGFEVCTAIR